jgi:hypothetical protein
MKKFYLSLILTIGAMISFSQGTYYSKASAVDFNDPLSWGKNADGSGVSPASIAGTDNFIVQNGAVLSLTANASVNLVVINAGSLVINANALTISINTQRNATLAINAGGSFFITGGSLLVNGNISLMPGGKFNQSGGSITVDGNDGGNIATSVSIDIPVVYFYPSHASDIALTSGTFTITDPHASTTLTDVFRLQYDSFGTVAATAGHTFFFGDGISADPGGNAAGFNVKTSESDGAFKFGNLVINGPGGINRIVTFGNSYAPILAAGNVVVNSGAELRHLSGSADRPLMVNGNLTVNGILTSAGTVIFGDGEVVNYGVIGLRPSLNAQVVSGSGTFRNSATSPTANFTSVLVNNAHPSGVSFSNANVLISGSNTGTVSSTLTLTAGTIHTGSNSFVLGISTSSRGTLVTGKGGFGDGSSFSRWFASITTGTTITAGELPSTTAGTYPFMLGSSERHLYIQRTGSFTGAVGGTITVKHTDASGLNVIASVVDNGYTINRQSAASWQVSAGAGFNGGSGAFTLAITGEGVLPAFTTNTRISKSAAVAGGTHQAGTLFPHTQRISIPAASFFGTYLLGINSGELPVESAQSGKWENASTWVGGIVPSCGAYVNIKQGHTVTVDAGSGTVNNSGTRIEFSGNLVVAGGILNVGCSNRNNTLNNYGILSVSGGNLNILGNLAINDEAEFIQSGGTISIDGNNGGVAATSVPAGTPLLGIGSSYRSFNKGTISLQGGKIVIVDPHTAAVNTSGYAIYANVDSAINLSGTHSVEFGDGASADAAGNTSGFFINTSAGGNRLNYYNLTINTPGNNRVTQAAASGVNGNFTITAGQFVMNGVALYIGGNTTVGNNGTMVTGGALYMATVDGTTMKTQTVPQSVSVSGAGLIVNSSTVPTVNFSSLTINNISASGVSFPGLNQISGYPANVISANTLFISNGKITTTGGATFIIASTSGLSINSGGFTPGSSFGIRFTSTSTNTGASITPATIPTVPAGRYPFLDAAGNNRSAWIERVTPTGDGFIAITYQDATTNTAVSINDAGYIVQRRYNGNWTVSLMGTNPSSGSVKIMLAAPGAFSPDDPNGRIVYANAPLAGATQGGTVLPAFQRVQLSLADLTAGPLYIGTAIIGVRSVASGDWNNPATWSSGSVPIASDSVRIMSSHTIMVNAAAGVAGRLIVEPGAQLEIQNNSLTITGNTKSGLENNGEIRISGGTFTLGPVGGGNRSFVNNGALKVYSGILNVNGNLLFNSGSTFHQLGGNIYVDGNDGTSAGSVEALTDIVGFGVYTGSVTSANVVNTVVNGGAITIVDPHFEGSPNCSAGASLGVRLASNSNQYWEAPHTIIFGGTTGTNNSTGTAEFLVSCGFNGGSIYLGNVVVNGGASNRRVLVNSLSCGVSYNGLLVRGTLTINSGSELVDGIGNLGYGVKVFGDMVVNGIFRAGSSYGITFGGFTDPATGAPADNPQMVIINGSVMLASNTSGFQGLIVRNTSAAGVTFSSDITVGSLTLYGIINMSGHTLTLGRGTTPTNWGTLNESITYIPGKIINGRFKRYLLTGGDKLIFPVGSSSAYRRFTVEFASGVTAGGTITTEWITDDPGKLGLPLNDAGITVNTTTDEGFWRVVAADGLAGGTYTVNAEAPGLYGVYNQSRLVLVKRANVTAPWTIEGTRASFGTAIHPVASRTGFSGFSDFAIGGGIDNVLPVTLLEFKGEVAGSANVLAWITANESNNEGFVLEKSMDGINFTKLAFVPTRATGGSATMLKYGFTDSHPYSGETFYRLKTVNTDGSFNYSKIVLLSRKKTDRITRIYPNPMNKLLMLDIYSTSYDKLTIHVIDASGRNVIQRFCTVVPGNNSIQLDLAGLSTGSYFIRAISAKGEMQGMTFVKQ